MATATTMLTRLPNSVHTSFNVSSMDDYRPNQESSPHVFKSLLKYYTYSICVYVRMYMDELVKSPLLPELNEETWTSKGGWSHSGAVPGA